MSKTQRFCSTNNHGVLGLRRDVFAMGIFEPRTWRYFSPLKTSMEFWWSKTPPEGKWPDGGKTIACVTTTLIVHGGSQALQKIQSIYIYILCRVEYSLCNTKSSKHERLHSEFWKDLIAHKLSKRQTCTTEHVPLNRIVQAVKATKNE